MAYFMLGPRSVGGAMPPVVMISVNRCDGAGVPTLIPIHGTTGIPRIWTRYLSTRPPRG